MKTIPDKVIDKTWKRIDELTPEQGQRLMEKMTEEQPFIVAYLLAVEETIMAEILNGGAVIHIRFDGRSRDIPLEVLDVGPHSSDNAIKAALARYLETPEAKFRDYVIDRHETGNLTIRPEAVFG